MIAGALNGGMRRRALVKFGAGPFERDQTECCNLSILRSASADSLANERVSMRSNTVVQSSLSLRRRPQDPGTRHHAGRDDI